MIQAGALTSNGASRGCRTTPPSADSAGLSGRLAVLERLLASAAYEVSAPTQFAADSVHYAQDALAHLAEIARLQGWIIGDYEAGLDPRPRLEQLEATRARARTQVSREEIGRALERALAGLDRITAHSRAIRSFVQLPCGEARPVDLNRIVDVALVLGAPEYRRTAFVTRVFADLPPVECDPGRLAEALVALFADAAETLRVAGADGPEAQLDVHTRAVDGFVEVAITVGVPLPHDACLGSPTAGSARAATGKPRPGYLVTARQALLGLRGSVLQVEPGAQSATRYTLSLPLGSSRPAGRKPE